VNNKLLGSFWAAVAAISYGLNPLFAIPLYSEGFDTWQTVFFRYFLGTLMMCGMMMLSFKNLLFPIRYVFPMFCAGSLMSGSSVTLFYAYKLIDVGIAGAVLFTYPILVALIMWLGFKEKLSIKTAISIVTAMTGVMILSLGEKEHNVSITGIFIVLLSSSLYACYLILIRLLQRSYQEKNGKRLSSKTISFYSLLFGIPILLPFVSVPETLTALHTPLAWTCALASAFFPTILSLFATAYAISLVGPTVTATFGALESATSVVIGVLIFKEILTFSLCIGLVLITFAVSLLIFQKK